MVILASLMTGAVRRLNRNSPSWPQVLNRAMILGLLVVSAGVSGYICSPRPVKREGELEVEARRRRRRTRRRRHVAFCLLNPSKSFKIL